MYDVARIMVVAATTTTTLRDGVGITKLRDIFCMSLLL